MDCHRCQRDLGGRRQVMVQLEGAPSGMGRVPMCKGCAPKRKSVKRAGES